MMLILRLFLFHVFPYISLKFKDVIESFKIKFLHNNLLIYVVL